jgi:hypothetical protein
MELQFLIAIVSVLKDHMADTVVIFCIIIFTIYHVKEKKWLKLTLFNSHNKYLNANILKLVKNSACINRQLSTLLYKLEADRASVYIFHNSGSDLLGQPFAKVTNTNEVTFPGLQPMLPYRKDIPVGLMASYLECLLVNRELRCCDIDQYTNLSEEEASMHSYLRSMGVQSSYAVALFCTPNDAFGNRDSANSVVPLGFVSIDYIRNKKTLCENELQRLRDAAMIMKGFMLSENYKEDL